MAESRKCIIGTVTDMPPDNRFQLFNIHPPHISLSLIHISSRMPSKYKVNDEQNKVALRTAAAKVLPEEIAFRKKLGFIVPIRIWMADARYNQDVQMCIRDRIIMLVGVGIYFTIRTRGVQLRLLKDGLKTLIEKSDRVENEDGKKRVSSFQALMISTASRVGTGNIAGIARCV